MTDARTLLEAFIPHPNAEPEDVRRFIAEGVRPFVNAPRVELDEAGNLIAPLGPEPAPDAPPFYVCAYAQDFGPGKMENPYEAKIVEGAPYEQDGDCLRGRGNCEHRGALAAALAAFNALGESDAAKRPLVFLVLTTGESGHHNVIEQALEGNSLSPGPALIARGTGNRVCLGNKGSLHVRIEIHGRSYHPSNPAKALNAIDGAEEALRRLRAHVSKNPLRDEDLGDSVLVPIEIDSRPKGPIIPDLCAIEVSGRLLPGQDPEKCTAGLREALRLPGGFRTEVILERYHYPAKVAPNDPLAAAAQEAVREVRGQSPPLYMHASLDAGYFCHHGQAAISLGPGAPDLAHSAHDMVSLKELNEGTRIYLLLLRRLLAD